MPDRLRTLRNLKRLREEARDRCRLALAEAYDARTLLEQRCQLLEREYRTWQANRRQAARGSVDVDHLAAVNRHQFNLRAQQAYFDENRRKLETEIARRQAALVEADRALRTVERLIERREEAFQRAEARRAERQADDQATTRWWHRETET